MGKAEDELQNAREEFAARNQKVRRWQVLIIPFLIACLVPALGFLWFSTTKPVAEAKPPLASAAVSDQVTVRIGGDIMLAGVLGEKIVLHGIDYPFRNIGDFLQDADLSLATLETTLADSGEPLPGKLDIFRAHPSAGETLLFSGLDVLNLASNHMVDYDTPALEQTLTILDGVGISHFGAGLDEKTARQPYIQEVGGLRIAYLAYCENADLFFSFDYPRSLMAKEDEAGVAQLEAEGILADIAAAKRTCDVVVLNLHWGDEFSYLPRANQQELAHRLVDVGADVIVGSHPHSLQSVELYHNGLIFYSLGNLAYAQTMSLQVRQSAILELELTKLGWQKARLYPLLLNDEGQPALASGQDALDVLERVRDISSGFGANFIPEGETLLISR